STDLQSAAWPLCQHASVSSGPNRLTPLFLTTGMHSTDSMQRVNTIFSNFVSFGYLTFKPGFFG
ncbi:hypothetical protein LDJ79_11320, partial [Vibrio tritonius]